MKKLIPLVFVALFVVLISVLFGLFKHKMNEPMLPSRDSEVSERFVPSSAGKLRGIDCKFVIVTDCFTGLDYMVVEGCGIVKLEAKAKQETDLKGVNRDAN
jgi:hypothetical protein